MNAQVSVTATVTEFMERVLPWPGPQGSGWGNLHYSLTKGGSKRWRGEPFKTAQELVDRAQKLALAPPEKCEDIFFCTSIQAVTGTRKYEDRTFAVAARHANQAVALKSIFLDVDIKDPPKGYSTLKEALDAIAKFCADAKLPGPSAFVLSGGGLHVYWISHRPLTVAEWRPFAEGLKHEAMRLGLRCDYGVTSDPARILRVPGTFNRKIPGRPRAVKVLGLGADHDFAKALAHIAATGVTAGPAKPAGSAPAPFDLKAFSAGPAAAFASLNPQTDNLADGLKSQAELLLNPTEIIKKCPHYRESFTKGGNGQDQGLWMLTVLGCTWFENGRAFAHALSKDYPSYTREETDEMYDRKVRERAERGLGWPSCQAFAHQGCQSCSACVHNGQISSPLNLHFSKQQTPQPGSTEPFFVDPYSGFTGPPFPLNVLPPTLAKFVNAGHRAMGADASAIAMAALTVAAGAIHAETRIRAGEGWWERPILWTALIGEPSTKKSPIISKAQKPLTEIDHDNGKRWSQEYDTWQQQNQK